MDGAIGQGWAGLGLVSRPASQRHARAKMGDYSFAKKGVSRFDLSDPYHLAVTLSWPQFLGAMMALYLCVNVIFALLYLAVPGALSVAARPHFMDAFFFSFETLATVGYGEIYPGSLYGHLVSSAEIMCGLAFTAILTGLTFARFARPRARFVFADALVITMHEGHPTLMLRVANGRATAMGETRAKLNVLLSGVSREGKNFRTAHELVLSRSHLPVLPLAWTLMHPINERSPLFGMDGDAVRAADARIFVTLQSHDPVLAAEVHDVRAYRPDQVQVGMHYVDAITDLPDGTPELDLGKISAIAPDEEIWASDLRAARRHARGAAALLQAG